MPTDIRVTTSGTFYVQPEGTEATTVTLTNDHTILTAQEDVDVLNKNFKVTMEPKVLPLYWIEDPQYIVLSFLSENATEAKRNYEKVSISFDGKTFPLVLFPGACMVLPLGLGFKELTLKTEFKSVLIKALIV